LLGMRKFRSKTEINSPKVFMYRSQNNSVVDLGSKGGGEMSISVLLNAMWFWLPGSSDRIKWHYPI